MLVGQTAAGVKLTNMQMMNLGLHMSPLMLSRIVKYVCVLSRNKVEFNPVTIKLTSFDKF